jgi:hypothetical protein
LPRQHRLTVLAGLSSLDAEHHALAVDIRDLHRNDLGNAQARAIGDAERGLPPLLQVRGQKRVGSRLRVLGRVFIICHCEVASVNFCMRPLNVKYMSGDRNGAEGESAIQPFNPFRTSEADSDFRTP